ARGKGKPKAEQDGPGPSKKGKGKEKAKGKEPDGLQSRKGKLKKTEEDNKEPMASRSCIIVFQEHLPSPN
ncbi:hypothetical protein H0H81_008423, partial [Sphagnurus paluster]